MFDTIPHRTAFLKTTYELSASDGELLHRSRSVPAQVSVGAELCNGEINSEAVRPSEQYNTSASYVFETVLLRAAYFRCK